MKSLKNYSIYFANGSNPSTLFRTTCTCIIVFCSRDFFFSRQNNEVYICKLSIFTSIYNYSITHEWCYVQLQN